MHELALAQGILQILEDQAREAGFQRVKAVFLEIGQLSHVEPEALRFCFDAVTRESLAAGARLEIDEPAGEGHCPACGDSGTLSALYDPCPTCGKHGLRVTRGLEMRVKQLEVE